MFAVKLLTVDLVLGEEYLSCSKSNNIFETLSTRRMILNCCYYVVMVAFSINGYNDLGVKFM